MPAGLFRSQDGGASWNLMDALWLDERRKGWFGGGNDHPGLHAVCVDPRDSNRVTIAISCGGVWRTLDAVAHWRLLGKGFHAPYMPPERDGDASVQDVHAMAACTAQPDVMWAQHHDGTYRSVDGGAHWSRTAAAMPTVFGLPIVADPVNPLRAWTCRLRPIPIAKGLLARRASAAPMMAANTGRRSVKACRSRSLTTRCTATAVHWPRMAAPWRWPRPRVRGSVTTQASRGRR